MWVLGTELSFFIYWAISSSQSFKPSVSLVDSSTQVCFFFLPVSRLFTAQWASPHPARDSLDSHTYGKSMPVSPGQRDDAGVKSLPLLCQSSPKRLYSVLWLPLHSTWMNKCRITSGIAGRSWGLKYRTKPRNGFPIIWGQRTEQKGSLRDGALVLGAQFKLTKSSWKLNKKIDSMMLSGSALCLLKGETCGTPF